MTDDRGHEGYRGELGRRCVTIAEALRPGGYRTYMAGKWHVTKLPGAGADRGDWPRPRRFDRFYGTIIDAGSLWDPAYLVRDDERVSAFADPGYEPAEPYYHNDAIADHAVRFVREHHAAHAEQPFFLYAAFTAAHWPMHAREADIAAMRGKYDGRYEAVRRARYGKMVELGVVSRATTGLMPLPRGKTGTEFEAWDRRNMEVYAAMIAAMDRGIGRLVEALRETGVLENTLICYLQNNGGCAEGIGRGGRGEARAGRILMWRMARRGRRFRTRRSGSTSTGRTRVGSARRKWCTGRRGFRRRWKASWCMRPGTLWISWRRVLMWRARVILRKRAGRN